MYVDTDIVYHIDYIVLDRKLIMNIYEQLNKINDTESLSEKYNVKNATQIQESIKNPSPRMFKRLCVSKDTHVCEEACNILFDYYNAEGAFEDFTSIRDFLDFVRTDVYDMLDAALYSDEIKVVCDALGLDYSLYGDDTEEFLQESASWSEKTYKFKYIPSDSEYYTEHDIELDMSEEDIDKAYKTKKFPSVMWIDGEAHITRNNDDDSGSYYEVSWTSDSSDYVECSSVAECKAVVSDYYDGNVRWVNIKQTRDTDEINFNKYIRFLWGEHEKLEKLLKPEFKLIKKYLKNPHAYGTVSDMTSKTVFDRATSAPEILIDVSFNQRNLSEAKRVVDDVLSGIAVFKGYNKSYRCLVYDLTGDTLSRWNKVVEEYLDTHDVNLDYAKNIQHVFNTGELVSID